MKKLMTMLAAVGLAFGLFADDPAPTPINSTSFEVGDTETTFDQDGKLNLNAPWSCLDENATLKQGAYNDDNYEYTTQNKRYGIFDVLQDNFLDIKTSFANPLERAENVTISEGEEVYFDQLVKFTAFEEPAEIAGDAKIALYVQEVMDENDEPTATNLCVVAGKYVAGELIQVTNEFPFADVDAWHRVTIKTLRGYDNSELAFQIFVDSVALKMATAAFDSAAAARLSPDAKVINSAKKLFASLQKTDVTVESIAFAGTGAIDDVIATKEEPGEWAENKVVIINWDPEVTGFTYTFGGDSTPVTTEGADPVQIPFSEEFDVTLSAMTFSNNWAYAGYDLGDNHFNTEVIRFTGEGQTATIKAKDVTPRVQVVIGDVTNTYPTIVAALANSIADGATITLGADLTGANGVTVNDNGITEAKFKSDGSIVLDLAGHTIELATGAELVSGGLLNVYQCAGFTLTDTVGYGCVDGGITVVNNNGTKFSAIGENPFFVDGKVDVKTGATSEISGGSFLASENTTPDEKFALKVKEGFQATLAGTNPDYWVVAELPAHKLTVTGAANATFTINGKDEEEVELKEGADYTVVATADEDYEYADTTYADGWVYDAGTVKNAGTMGTSDIALTVPAPTATDYEITYIDPETEEAYSDVPQEFKTYTVETKNKTLFTPPATQIVDGYDFTNWKDENEEVFTGESFADRGGGLELKANFATPHNYTITYNLGGGEVAEPNPSTYTIESEDITLNNPTKEGFTFAGWTGTDLEEPTMEVTIDTGSTGNREYTAQWESAQTDPLPDIDPQNPGAKDQVTTNLKAAFGDESSAAQNITEVGQYKAFNSFLTEVDVTDISTDMTPAQKQYAYESFVLSSITANDQLFTEKPVLKETAITVGADTVEVKIALTAGEQTIALAKDELAKYVKVGGAVDAIVDAAKITATAGETEITLTVDMSDYPTAGFTKVVIPTPTQAN